MASTLNCLATLLSGQPGKELAYKSSLLLELNKLLHSEVNLRVLLDNALTVHMRRMFHNNILYRKEFSTRLLSYGFSISRTVSKIFVKISVRSLKIMLKHNRFVCRVKFTNSW